MNSVLQPKMPNSHFLSSTFGSALVLQVDLRSKNYQKNECLEFNLIGVHLMPKI
jgi:hypothetical protein